MHFLLNMGIFHCYVGLPKGTTHGEYRFQELCAEESHLEEALEAG